MILSHCSLSFSHHTVFEDFQFELASGEWTCILGPSGVGKSSLLKIIAGLIAPDNLADNMENTIPTDIAYLPQHDCLMPWLSLWDNLWIGYTLRGQSTTSLHNRALELLDKTGLIAAKDLKPDALSGGMKQRTALVRTLLEDKPIILMDEPFSSVDMATRFELHEITAQLLKNKTVLLVTHDPLDAVRLGDHIYVLTGSPAKLHKQINPLCAPLYEGEEVEKKPRELNALAVTHAYIDLLQTLCHNHSIVL